MRPTFRLSKQVVAAVLYSCREFRIGETLGMQPKLSVGSWREAQLPTIYIGSHLLVAAGSY